MKRNVHGSFVLVLLLTTFLFFLFLSCVKKDEQPTLKVGLAGAVGGFDDRGFNEMALFGLMSAASMVPIPWEARVSGSAALIDSNIRYFVRNDFDLIITVGYEAAKATMDAAIANPSRKFLLLDYSFESVPQNMICAVFSVDQASFPCGFLAAYWAYHKDTVNPIVCYVAGPSIPGIDQFTVSYTKGVEYFNTKYHRSVLVTGANAANFGDTVQGAFLADSLIQLGGEVVFACAGKTGNGALYKAKERGKAGIGVDVDQYYSIPQVGSCLLTSCRKNLDQVIQAEIINTYNGQFRGGNIFQWTLAMQGVGLAGYHDFENAIPDTIKQAVIAIKTGIINGTISTGWPK